MNYFDVILIIIISLVTVRGLFRGLITELFTLVALILGFFLACFYLSNVSQLLIDTFSGLPIVAARIISFIGIFLTVNISIRLLARMLNKFAKFALLQPINRIAGALFALTKVLLLLSIIFLSVDLFPHSDLLISKMNIDKSLLYEPVKKVGPGLYHILIYILPNHEQLYEEFLEMFNRADNTAREIINQSN